MKRKRISKTTIRHAQDALAILFPSVRCTVAPNGSDELWVKDNAGYGFSLRLSAGNAGVGTTIRKFAGAPAVTVTGNDWPDANPIQQVDAVEVSTCVYRNDAYAQAHKAWYAIDSAGLRGKHPSELGIESPYVPFEDEVKA